MLSIIHLNFVGFFPLINLSYYCLAQQSGWINAITKTVGFVTISILLNELFI